MPPEIAQLARQYLFETENVQVDRSGAAAEDVEHELVVVLQEDKPEMLRSLLGRHGGSVLVFTRTRHGARKLARIVQRLGHPTSELHSDRSLDQRRAALDGFKSGLYRVLIATDIAARGIDVKDIALVINYDVPQKPEDYVHRIGRTGRAGASGLAITMATPDQHRDVRDIERLLKAELPISRHSKLQLPSAGPEPGRRDARPARGFRRREDATSARAYSRRRGAR
jgi:ATP-dependent RNA helicase RhlE